jgi:DNA-binding PadR family transcriptional regulator
MHAYAAGNTPRDVRWDVQDVLGAFKAMTGGRGGRHPGHHRHHRGPGGPGGFGGFGGGFPFGGPPFGGGGGGPYGRGGGRRARRGDVRTAVLMLLAEEPRNGYQIMQEIEQRSEGSWRASPGSVYPALQQLEDEGLVRAKETDGRKLFELTDDGQAAVAERPQDAPAPWEETSHGFSDQKVELGALMREVAQAFVQVIRVGGDRQLAEAKKLLSETRRTLYRILADGEDEGATDAEPEKS